MKKTKVISCLLAAAVMAASFAGCGDSKAAASAEDPSSKQEQSQRQDQRGNIAKVVSLEGNKLTVVLADMPDRSNSAPPDQTGSTSGGAAQTDGKPPQNSPKPTDNGGEPGGHQGQPGQGGPEIKFSGDEVTYTLSDEVTITKGRGDQAAKIDLSEITQDSVIRFTMTTDDGGDEVINSIMVME